ncbi:MAG: hypothetical protein JRH20_25095 [Deltaproteobacteria bacterium]|nr:hypothetical protein [Deltaproteobacteria bacterium]
MKTLKAGLVSLVLLTPMIAWGGTVTWKDGTTNAKFGRAHQLSFVGKLNKGAYTHVGNIPVVLSKATGGEVLAGSGTGTRYNRRNIVGLNQLLLEDARQIALGQIGNAARLRTGKSQAAETLTYDVALIGRGAKTQKVDGKYKRVLETPEWNLLAKNTPLLRATLKRVPMVSYELSVVDTATQKTVDSLSSITGELVTTLAKLETHPTILAKQASLLKSARQKLTASKKEGELQVVGKGKEFFRFPTTPAEIEVVNAIPLAE